MWFSGWREEVWSRLGQGWDILVIGGGITGAGLFREAVRLGLRSLLVEQHDFAWGTSSRSSKLVHGGLRYLKEGKIGLTRDSVLEREALLAEAPGLIDPLGFLLTVYKGDFPGRLSFGMGLTVYDLLALRWDHEYYSAEDFAMLAPHISQEGLQGGFRYGDAQTDDARLVLRLIREAVAEGGVALNYAQAEELIVAGQGPVRGIRLKDQVTGRMAEVSARVVVNATGAWADWLRQQAGSPLHRPERRIRPLRGSHLVFPAWRLPVAQAVSFLHPVDRRPVFIFPWEGVTLVGTTDVDCEVSLDREPRISPDEVAYLMAAVESQFPSLAIGLEDVLTTFAGVRPVIASGKKDPSQESREHVIWHENGLLTVTGGKLTTFRLIAQDALREVCRCIPGAPTPEGHGAVLNPLDIQLPGASQLDESLRRRLVGRFGAEAVLLVAAAQEDELETIAHTQTLWAELRWAARAEGVVHLDDLLLRRVRLGLTLPEGGKAWLPHVRRICQAELGWDNRRWETEQEAYQKLWHSCYSLPDPQAIPDWRLMLAQARTIRTLERPVRRRRTARRAAAAVALISLTVASILFLLNREQKWKKT